MNINQYENISKELVKAIRIANNAAISSCKLDEKIRFQKLKNELQIALNKIQLMYYEFKDALDVKIVIRYANELTPGDEVLQQIFEVISKKFQAIAAKEESIPGLTIVDKK